LNAEALCYGCHSHYGGTQERREEVLTREQQDLLYEKIRNQDLAKEYKRTKGVGPVAKHYRDELKRMQEQRDLGVTGRIEFVGYL
jgi:hypothetical protein